MTMPRKPTLHEMKTGLSRRRFVLATAGAAAAGTMNGAPAIV